MEKMVKYFEDNIFNQITIDDCNRVKNDLGILNEKFYSKSVLITGSAGFLGINFMRYFYNLNYELNEKEKVKVYCIENFIREESDYFFSFFKNSNFSLIKRDVLIGIDDLSVKFDFIIHAATIASPIFYRKWPIETMDANVIGLRKILDWSVNNIPESILFFSSSEIYGDPDINNIPTSEDYNGNVSCTGPRACYDESKRYGETLCVNYWQIHKIPIKIARPFNNYGPGLSINDGRVIPDFFNNIIKNQNIEILSDGKATRTFCYISDAINGYLRILLSDHNGEPFNIGIEEPEINIDTLAKKCIDVSNSKVKINYKISSDINYTIDNPNRRCPDISKAKNLLKFKPIVNIDDGLKYTFLNYKT